MQTAFKKRDELETRIASLLANADRAAIPLIYEHYAETLLGMIKRIVYRQEQAEEVLQDVFVKIWKGARSYNSKKGRLFTWFANIARNTAIDYTRSAAFKQSEKTTSTEAFVNKDTLGSVSSHIEDEGLRRVLAGLDPKYLELIELAYFQGYSQREIEKKTGIPLGTIKTRLREALRQLRTTLQDEHVRELLFTIAVTHTLINLFR